MISRLVLNGLGLLRRYRSKSTPSPEELMQEATACVEEAEKRGFVPKEDERKA